MERRNFLKIFGRGAVATGVAVATGKAIAEPKAEFIKMDMEPKDTDKIDVFLDGVKQNPMSDSEFINKNVNCGGELSELRATYQGRPFPVIQCVRCIENDNIGTAMTVNYIDYQREVVYYRCSRCNDRVVKSEKEIIEMLNPMRTMIGHKEDMEKMQFQCDLSDVFHQYGITNQDDIELATAFIINELRAGNGRFDSQRELKRLAGVYVAHQKNMRGKALAELQKQVAEHDKARKASSKPSEYDHEAFGKWFANAELK